MRRMIFAERWNKRWDTFSKSNTVAFPLAKGDAEAASPFFVARMPADPKTPSAFIESLSPILRPLAVALQEALITLEPHYDQLCAWKGLAFKRDDNYSCMIVPYKDHLKLMIWRGVSLEDPEGRLLGKGENTRHVLFHTESDINVPYLRMLLQQQFAMYDSGIPWEEPCETRKQTAMPTWVKKALQEHSLMDAYEDRPPYQRRDYLHWITSAKREMTQQSRLDQMLDELAAGDRYMKVVWGRKK